MTPLLDTHYWIWWMIGDSRIPLPERRFLDTRPAEDRPVISEISLWEAAMLVDLGRLQLDIPLPQWLRLAACPATVHRLGVSPEVVSAMNLLPETFQRDPADRLIVATARVHSLPVATHDKRIIQSGLVRIWSLES